MRGTTIKKSVLSTVKWSLVGSMLGLCFGLQLTLPYGLTYGIPSASAASSEEERSACISEANDFLIACYESCTDSEEPRACRKSCKRLYKKKLEQCED